MKDIIVAHPGTQHSYQVALSMQEAGRLKYYLTSFFYKRNTFPYNIFKLVKRFDEKMKKRYFSELDESLVINTPFFEFFEQIYRKIYGNTQKTTKVIYWRDRAFDRYVSLFFVKNDIKIFVGYPNASLYSFKKCKERDSVCILDLPIGYYKEAERLLEEEKELHPDFSDSVTYSDFDEIYKYRVDKEIEIADYIVVASEFVKGTLLKYGVDERKIIKIPYGSAIEPVEISKIKESGNNGPLKIIYAGQISQRKGIKYLLEAVRKLRKEGYNIELTLVGKIYGSGEGLKPYEGIFKYVPFVTRRELKEIFLSHDLFIFPSIFEGSALVILEALSCGLPVITTPNTGAEAIIEGENGFVVPIRDIDAICQKVSYIYDNRDLLMRMKVKALESSKRFTWEIYRQRWRDFINGISV